METFLQYELQRGTTHWVAWFSDEQLAASVLNGWVILHRWGPEMRRDPLTRLLIPVNR